MAFGKTAGVLVRGAAFRATGARGLGRGLVRDFLTGDEDARTAAGMLLVRAGDRSIGVLREALDATPDAEELVDVLAGIETPAAEAEMRRVAGEGSSPVAEKAAGVLERRARPGGESRRPDSRP